MGEIEKQAAAFEKLDVTVLPIVMNTRAEIQQAMRDLNNGTFIRPAH